MNNKIIDDGLLGDDRSYVLISAESGIPANKSKIVVQGFHHEALQLLLHGVCTVSVSLAKAQPEFNDAMNQLAEIIIDFFNGNPGKLNDWIEHMRSIKSDKKLQVQHVA